MAKQINHTAIGAFVVGAIALTIIAVMLFGTGNLFEKDIRYTMSFDKSVNGLTRGAPVMFRGIKIGEVVDIQLSYDEDNENAPRQDSNNNNANPKIAAASNNISATNPATRLSWPINVTVKLYPRSIEFAQGEDSQSLLNEVENNISSRQLQEKMENWLAEMILQKGLRAQLETQNFLTGLLYIELDLFQEEKTTQQVVEQVKKHIIPTRMSAFERLYLSFNQNDFTPQVSKFYKAANVIGTFFVDGKAQIFLDNLVAISTSFNDAMGAINEILADLRSDKAKQSLQDACVLIAELNQSSKRLNVLLQQNIPQLIGEAKDSFKTLNQSTETLTPKLNAAIDDAHKLINNLEHTIDLQNGPLAELNTKLNATVQNINDATADSRRVLQDAHALTAPDAPVIMELNKAITDMRNTMQSLNALVELLQENPEIILRGRND